MLMELIERKNQPVRTKVTFTKKEWERLSVVVKKQYIKTEHHVTKTRVYFIFDGDLINIKAGKKE